MTRAPQVEGGQGNPLFNLNLHAISEGLDGQGLLAAGDLEVTADGNTSMGFLVAPGDVWYGGDAYTLGAEHAGTLSEGDPDQDRWDTIAFDTSAEAIAVHEGAPDDFPTPPDLGADEFFLADVYVPSGATDIDGGHIRNWRVKHQGAENTRLTDSGGNFDSDTVEGALIEALQMVGNELEGPLNLTNFSGSTVLDLGDDPGAFGPIVDATSTTDASAGDPVSYSFSLDGTEILTVSGEATGQGGIQFPQVEVSTDLVTPGETVIWDEEDGYIPRPQIETNKNAQVLSSTPHTTSGEEIVFVDTDTQSQETTVVLSDTDHVDGNTIIVSDLSGIADSYPITVETESGVPIGGEDNRVIDSPGGALVFVSNGSFWTLGGGGVGGGGEPSDAFGGADSVSGLADGERAVLTTTRLMGDRDAVVEKVSMHTPDVQQLASGVSLEIATVDQSGGIDVEHVVATTPLEDGDGNDQVAGYRPPESDRSWTNDYGNPVPIGIFIHNQSGGAVDASVTVEGAADLPSED